MTDPEDPDRDLAGMLVELGSVLLTADAVDEILQTVVDLTERAVRSACAVSVTLVRDHVPFTSHSSQPTARALDEVQYRENAGPCLQALASGETVVTNPTADDDRWPVFAAEAAGADVTSVLSIPLTTESTSSGTLNIYAHDGAHFADDELAAAVLLARQAASVLSNAAAFADATAVNLQLREALDSRDVIGQAKGILMERENCDADAAFDILRRASQRTNRKLRDVAADLVATVTTRNQGRP